MDIPESPTRQKWREIIRRQQRSGLGAAAFCRDNAIPASSFFGWKRKLSQTDAPAFVEATIPVHRGSGRIEICLHGGRRLIVGRGVDPERLAEVAAVMEQLPGSGESDRPSRHGESGRPL